MCKIIFKIFHFINNEPRSSYWPFPVYTDKTLAETHAKKYGGEEIDCFYSDPHNPTYFVSFNDFDKVSFYLYSEFYIESTRKVNKL